MEQLSITLPADVARQVRAHVASGDYASEGDVVRAGLSLLAGDDTLAPWQEQAIVTAYDALRADPGRARTIDEVEAALAAARKANALR